MNTLDSRSLSYTDCFMQKFSIAGNFLYRLLPSALSGPGHDEDQYSIEVKPGSTKSREAKQHYVKVELREGQLSASPPQLVIEAGDVVIWNTSDSAIPGYVIRGEGKIGRFSSDALEKEAVYSHAFGIPGEYFWLDPHGGPAQGRIQVDPVDASDEESAAKWREKLQQGVVITVSGKKVSRTDVRILIGQTVFWAIEKASGLAIADARLLPKPKARETSR